MLKVKSKGACPCAPYGNYASEEKNKLHGPFI